MSVCVCVYVVGAAKFLTAHEGTQKKDESSILALEMGGAMNALSAAPDWKHVVVAGRDVLKIVRVDEDENGYPVKIEAVQNFRTGTRPPHSSLGRSLCHSALVHARWCARRRSATLLTRRTQAK